MRCSKCSGVCGCILQVVNTQTVDLSLAGLGTPSSPWLLQADALGAGVRPATVVVAASDSKHKNADVVCDGSDDDLAINAAFAQLNALPRGGSVLLLDGTYRLGHKIVAPVPGSVPGWALRGAGACRVVAQDPATFPDNCFLQVPDPAPVSSNPTGTDSLCVVDGLAFDQTDAPGTDLQDTSAIQIETNNVRGAVHVQECAFVNLQGHAIRSTVGGTTIHVVRNWFDNCQRAQNFDPFDTLTDGVVLDDGGALVFFLQDNDFTGFGDNGNWGLDFAQRNGGDFTVVSGNQFGFSGGLVLHGSKSISATGNTNLALRAEAGTNELVVVGNHAFRVSLDSCRQFAVEGNHLTCRSFGADPDALLKFSAIGLSGCDQGVVANNKLDVHDLEGHPILLDDSSDCQVLGNSVIPNTSLGTTHAFDGIRLQNGSDRNNVQGNMVRQGSDPSHELENGIHVATADCNDNLVTNNDLFGAWDGAPLVDAGTGTVTAAGNRT